MTGMCTQARKVQVLALVPLYMSYTLTHPECPVAQTRDWQEGGLVLTRLSGEGKPVQITGTLKGLGPDHKYYVVGWVGATGNE